MIRACICYNPFTLPPQPGRERPVHGSGQSDTVEQRERKGAATWDQGEDPIVVKPHPPLLRGTKDDQDREQSTGLASDGQKITTDSRKKRNDYHTQWRPIGRVW